MGDLRTDMPPARAAVFWKRTRREGECLIWTGSTNGRGYGQFVVCRRKTMVHRISYELTNGAVPDGLVVRHKCDVKLCVNPDHLCIGTHLDNARDKIDRRRAHHLNSVTDEQVLEMRELRPTTPLAVLARLYGVTKTCVGRIATGRAHRHLAGTIVPIGYVAIQRWP
jgi:hypothetical protein